MQTSFFSHPPNQLSGIVFFSSIEQMMVREICFGCFFFKVETLKYIHSLEYFSCFFVWSELLAFEEFEQRPASQPTSRSLSVWGISKRFVGLYNFLCILLNLAVLLLCFLWFLYFVSGSQVGVVYFMSFFQNIFFYEFLSCSH